METNQFHRGEKIAASAHRRHSFSPITTLAWLGACLLILLGVAFELGMLGFGPYNSSGVWLLFAIVKNGWIMLADLAVPELLELTKIWPLILVSLGSAILLAMKYRNRLDLIDAESAAPKENHGN